MCGFAGIRALAGAYPAMLETDVRRMAETLVHRGPDDSGTWCDDAAGLAFGFRRLSVIDLTEAGHQPMVSADGQWVIVMNGEVYNHAQIRSRLEARGVRFRGHSDTEAVLEACAAWGVAKAAQSFVGMFAFALWNRHSRSLWLVRDRLGVKPLYWGRFGSLLLFGSELKALRAHGGWEPELDLSALSGFLRYTHVPGPHAIYKGVRKLPPGTILHVAEDGSTQEEAYWTLAEVAVKGRSHPFKGRFEDAVQVLEDMLRESVSLRMLADVPVGTFLSGGIDSSLVTALMAEAARAPVKTFSIGFNEAAYDEAPRAKAIARHLGTDHTECYVSTRDALAIIPSLSEWYDEPFADSSQIPTALVSRLARGSVTVALSGDGGDEMFGGYGRYFAGLAAWKRQSRLPPMMRPMVASAIKMLSPEVWSVLLRVLPKRTRPQSGGHAVHWLAGTLSADPEIAYRQQMSTWTEPEEVLPGIACAHAPAWGGVPEPVRRDLFRHMQFLDTVTYLTDDILTKVDRASMAHALEVRGPLLDHRLHEFAWSLPTGWLHDGAVGKLILRRVLARHVPPQLTDHPKMGFGVPVGEWIKGGLRPWAEDLLASARSEGLFSSQLIEQEWQSHLAGRQGGESRLWAVLMFQAWKRRWLG